MAVTLFKVAQIYDVSRVKEPPCFLCSTKSNVSADIELKGEGVVLEAEVEKKPFALISSK